MGFEMLKMLNNLTSLVSHSIFAATSFYKQWTN
jgi:hypothetical protein